MATVDLLSREPCGLELADRTESYQPVLLHDADDDGVAETREAFLEEVNQPDHPPHLDPFARRSTPPVTPIPRGQSLGGGRIGESKPWRAPVLHSRPSATIEELQARKRDLLHRVHGKGQDFVGHDIVGTCGEAVFKTAPPCNPQLRIDVNDVDSGGDSLA